MAANLSAPVSPGKPKLLDQVRDVIRRKHYSIRTEQAYTDWRVNATHTRRGFSFLTPNI
jgi:hypothetical protein